MCSLGPRPKPTPARIASSIDPRWGWFGSGAETNQCAACTFNTMPDSQSSVTCHMDYMDGSSHVKKDDDI